MQEICTMTTTYAIYHQIERKEKQGIVWRLAVAAAASESNQSIIEPVERRMGCVPYYTLIIEISVDSEW